MLFYYFNGLNSAILPDYSGSPKIVAAGAFALAHGYQFIPVSTDYRRAAETADQLLESLDPRATEVIFCGSSMGGWFARILQLMLKFMRLIQRVNIYRDQAGAQNTEQRDRVLQQVGHHDGDTVAPLKPEVPLQIGCKPGTQIIDLGIGKRAAKIGECRPR